MTDITLPREIVEQAFKALEEIALAGMSVAPEMLDEKEAFHARQAWRFIGIAARALESVKKARAEQPERDELQAKGEHPAPCARHCEANAFQIVIKNLQAQLAQPEQIPPSAYSNTHQPEQEPVREPDYGQEEARRYAEDRNYWRNRYEALVEPLTEALAQPEQEPAHRTWVGLTDEERNVINRNNVYVSDLIGATEAKLKEKNT